MTTHPTIQRTEAILKKQGWKKSQFCEKMNINSQTYNNWRKRGIPANRIRHAADILNVSRDWLEDGEPAATESIAEDSNTYYLKVPGKNEETDRMISAFNKLSLTQRSVIIVLMEHMNDSSVKAS